MVSKENSIKFILLSFLSVWILFIGIKTILWTPVPMGESDDYMLTTVSLQYEHNLGLHEADILNAERDFPEFAEYLRICYETGEQSSIVDEENGRMPWYFGTYSAICIPIKVLLGVFNAPQILSFALTNYILYLAVILFALFAVKGSFYEKYALALLFAVNPVVFYIVWQSSEVFMFAMIALSLMCWKNKNYYFAGLFVSIAGTMNSTAMVLGVFIIIDYFFDIFAGFQSIKTFWRTNLKNTVLLAACFIPCLIPFLYYKLKFGCWNLQVSYGFASGEDQYIGRILSYLFDWNYGIFPYFPILFIVFTALGVWAILKRKYRNLFYWGAFLGVIAAYSIMFHINCGMSGIARYSVWCAPIMIVGTVSMYQTLEISKSDIRKMLATGIVSASALFSVIQLNVYGVMFASNTSDIQLTPVGKFVIEKMPSLYIELKSSFIARAGHIPGGYLYSNPIYYYNDERIVTKILLQNGDENKAFEKLIMDKKAQDFVLKQTEDKTGLYYITIPKKYNIKMSLNEILNQYSCINNGFIELSALNTSGEYDNINNCIILNKGEIQFGPYIDLYAGKYQITITGDNLTKATEKVTAQSGAVDLSALITFDKITDREIIYSFNLQEDGSRVEFLTWNNGEADVVVQINSVKLVCNE